HGFDVKFAVFQNLGHVRTPSLAASFFARTCNATPKTPPVELARLQVKELPAGRTVALADGAASRPLPPIRSTQRTGQADPTTPESRLGKGNGTTGRDAGARASGASVGDGRSADRSAVPLRIRPVSPQPNAKPTAPRREVPPVRDSDTEGPVRVRVSSTIGISPLLVSYSATLPARLQRSAFYLWTDNGEPISNGINGQKFFTEPGVHRLGVLVTTKDGQEYRAGQKITVLERIGKDDAD
ncbi:MAG: hypothetical protein GY778_08405, partial [bacterium]|nr:hypothetical protein [bacterium]